MKGYIIKSGELHLAKGFYWFRHPKNTDAYVHPLSILNQLRQSDFTKNWSIKPDKAIPAIFENGKTTITGESFYI